jgi:tetratricopeptide (TPR) repeat protein
MIGFALALSLAAGLVAPAQAPGEATTLLPVVDVAQLPGSAGKVIGEAYAAARAHPKDPELVGRLAITLHAWEQWDAAAATYKALRTLAPRDRRWWYLAGLLETARGRHGDALPLFERAAALAPGDAAGRLRLAEARLETADFSGSEPLLLQLAREPATAAPAEYGAGRVAAARGDYAGAVAHFEKAVKAFPDFGAAHYALALAYRRLGRPVDAAKALERQQKCLACWPAVEDPVASLIPAAREDASAVMKRGIQLAAEGDVRGAIDAHERALSLTPSLVQARVNLITLYGRNGRYADAEAQYRKLIADGKNVGEAQANYAHVLLAQRRAAEAIPVFRDALISNPRDGAVRNGLGLALEMTGDSAGALAAYQQAVADAPTERKVRFNYGRALVAAGRLDEAIAQFEKLQEPEDEETPRYLFALSAARIRAGDVARGRSQALGALAMARRYGQTELAASIERDLRGLK